MSRMERTLLLIDGEHYPPVIEAALPTLRKRRLEPVGALFLGGFEKTSAPPDLPIPVHSGDPCALLPKLIAALDVDTVMDLSDEPVVNPRERFTLAGIALAAGASYAGGGFRFDPPKRTKLTMSPSVTVAGTGKRTGKTAVAIDLARHWKAAHRRTCIVTMGRGGPPEPVFVGAGEAHDPVRLFQRLMDAGLHPTSDYVEDAIFAGVDTIGTRRVGAGPAGVVVDANFEAGVARAIELDPEIVIYEGSGTAVPPVEADATVLVARSTLDPEFLVGYLGSYRLMIASALVVIEGTEGSDDLIQAARRVRPDLTCLVGRLMPEPTVSVMGRSVVLATTAPPAAAGLIENALLGLGAESVRSVHSLSDRRRLLADLGHLDRDCLVLTEVKAAAAGIVLPAAEAVGADVGFVHNAVMMDGGIGTLAGIVEEQFEASASTHHAVDLTDRFATQVLADPCL